LYRIKFKKSTLNLNECEVQPSVAAHTLNGDLTWSAYTWNGQDALMYDPEQLHEAIEAWINGETYEVEATPDGE
jgi:hypothetical protein